MNGTPPAARRTQLWIAYELLIAGVLRFLLLQYLPVV